MVLHRKAKLEFDTATLLKFKKCIFDFHIIYTISIDVADWNLEAPMLGSCCRPKSKMFFK